MERDALAELSREQLIELVLGLAAEVAEDVGELVGAAVRGVQGEPPRASVAQATAGARRDQSSQTAAGRDRALPSDRLPRVW
jgi:hypothetical protein